MAEFSGGWGNTPGHLNPSGFRHATGTLRPIGLAGLNTFPDPEPVQAVSPTRAAPSPSPLAGTGSFVLSSRPARRGAARAAQPMQQLSSTPPMYMYTPQQSFVSVPSLTVIPPSPAPAPSPPAPMRVTITTPAQQQPAPAPVDTHLSDALTALQREVAGLRQQPPAPSPPQQPPASVSDADILALLAQAAAAQPQPQHITIRQEGHSLDGGAIMQALQSLGANMAELHTAQACTRSAVAAAADGTNGRVARSHMQLSTKASHLQGTADEILDVLRRLATEQGQDEGGIAAVAAATAGHVGSTVGNAVAAGLAELAAAQEELAAAVREALNRPAAPPAAPPAEPAVTEMWEEYSSAGGDSSDCNESSASSGSSGRYETLDEYIGTAEARGTVPAVYGAAYSATVAEVQENEVQTLDEYLSDGEVAPGEDYGELSDGEVITTNQADVSFVSTKRHSSWQ